MSLQTCARNKASSMSPGAYQAGHRTLGNATAPWQILSAWRNWKMPWRRWRQGKPLDQMESQEKCWNILKPSPEQYFWRTTDGTCSLERSRDYTSSKERQRQEEPSHLPPHQSSRLCRQIAREDGEIGVSSATWRTTVSYLQHKRVTGSSEAQRTNLPALPRTSKMHSRRKRRFWQFSSIFQMHLTRTGKGDFS